MRLIPNWKEVALHSISMQAIYLGLLVLTVPELYFLATGAELLGPYVKGWVGLALLIGGGIGRLIDEGMQGGAQADPGRTTRRRRWRWGIVLAVTAAFFLAGCQTEDTARDTGAQTQPAAVATMPAPDAEFLEIAVPFVGKWEGLKLTAYRDIVGVWTVCYGETNGVKPGDHYTKAECDAMLAAQLLRYRAGLHHHFTPETKTARLHVLIDVAYTDLAYNVGVTATGKSTAVRRLNAGDITGGCAALTWFNKAGGRVIRGLVNRRAEDQAMCLRGAAEVA